MSHLYVAVLVMCVVDINCLGSNPCPVPNYEPTDIFFRARQRTVGGEEHTIEGSELEENGSAH